MFRVAERLVVGGLLPESAELANGCYGRGPSVAHPAGFRVEQTFERQLAGDLQLPLLAELGRSVFMHICYCNAQYQSNKQRVHPIIRSLQVQTSQNHLSPSTR